MTRLSPNIIAFALLTSACASMKTTSQSTPGAPPAHYERILVAAVTSNLRLRIAAESSFVRAGRRAGVDVIPYHAIFLPGQQLSEEQIARDLTARGIGAVLILRDNTTDPPTRTASAAVVPLCSMSVGGKCVQGTTVVTGSTSSSQDKFTIASEVVDVQSGQPVWVGSTRAQRNGATDGGLFSSLGRNVIETLAKGGVVRVSRPAP